MNEILNAPTQELDLEPDVTETVKVTLEVICEIDPKRTIVEVMADIANLKHAAASFGTVTGVAHFGRKKYRL